MNFTDVPHQGVSYDSSLVGYWRFNEGAGLIGSDSSSNGNNGTLVNSPTWVTGKYGDALSFGGTGTNQYVSVANSPTLQLSGPFTISFWWNRTLTTGHKYFFTRRERMETTITVI
jgi:hypothetical protein